MKIEANYLGNSILMKYRREFYIVDAPSPLNYTLLVERPSIYYPQQTFSTLPKTLFSVKHPTLKNLTQLSLLELKFHVS